MATKPKLTPWFPPEIKPVRVGWYETYVHDKGLKRMRYWNRRSWLFMFDENIGKPPKLCRASSQKQIWRGLSERPK